MKNYSYIKLSAYEPSCGGRGLKAQCHEIFNTFWLKTWVSYEQAKQFRKDILGKHVSA